MESERLIRINKEACELYSVNNDISTDNTFQTRSENITQDYDILSEVTIQINNEIHTLYVGPVQIKSTEHVQKIQSSNVSTYFGSCTKNKHEPQQQYKFDSILRNALQRPIAEKGKHRTGYSNKISAPKQCLDKNNKFNTRLTAETLDTSNITSNIPLMISKQPISFEYSLESPIIKETKNEPKRKPIVIEFNSTDELENRNEAFPKLVQLANGKNTVDIITLTNNNIYKNNLKDSSDIQFTNNLNILKKINNNSEISVSKIDKIVKHFNNNEQFYINDNIRKKSTQSVENTIDLKKDELSVENINSCQNKLNTKILNPIVCQHTCVAEDITSVDNNISTYEKVGKHDIKKISYALKFKKTEEPKPDPLQPISKESKLKTSILNYLKSQTFNKTTKSKISGSTNHKTAIKCLPKLKSSPRNNIEDKEPLKIEEKFDYPHKNKPVLGTPCTVVHKTYDSEADIGNSKTNIPTVSNRLKSIENGIQKKTNLLLKNESQECLTNSTIATKPNFKRLRNAAENTERKYYLRRQNSRKLNDKKPNGIVFIPLKVNTASSKASTKRKIRSQNKALDKLSNSAIKKITKSISCTVDISVTEKFTPRYEANDKLVTSSKNIVANASEKTAGSAHDNQNGANSNEKFSLSELVLENEIKEPNLFSLNKATEECVLNSNNNVVEHVIILPKVTPISISTSDNITTKIDSNSVNSTNNQSEKDAERISTLSDCISTSNTIKQAASICSTLTAIKPSITKKTARRNSDHLASTKIHNTRNSSTSITLSNLSDKSQYVISNLLLVDKPKNPIEVQGITSRNYVNNLDTEKRSPISSSETIPNTENVNTFDELNENQNIILEESITTELIQSIIDNLAESKDVVTVNNMENCVKNENKTISKNDCNVVTNKPFKKQSRRNTSVSYGPPRKSRRLINPEGDKKGEAEEEEYVNEIHTNYQHQQSGTNDTESVGERIRARRHGKQNGISQKSDLLETTDSENKKIIGSRKIEDLPEVKTNRKRKFRQLPKVFRRRKGNDLIITKVLRNGKVVSKSLIVGVSKAKRLEKNNKLAKVQTRPEKTNKIKLEKILRSKIVDKQIEKKNIKTGGIVEKVVEQNNSNSHNEKKSMETMEKMTNKINTTVKKKSSIKDYFSEITPTEIQIPEETIKLEIALSPKEKHPTFKVVQQNMENHLVSGTDSVKLENGVVKSYDKKSICKVCNLKFTNSGTLTTHVKRVHIKLKNKICTHCKRAFTCTGDLTRHIRTHTGEKPFLCEFDNCGQRFITSGALYKHQRKSHKGETKSRTHSCTKCYKAFERPYDLRRHMMSHELNNPEFNGFVCAICKKKFARRDELTSHLKRHAGIKDYKCQCGRAFTDSSNFNKHLRMSGHTRENAMLNGTLIKDLYTVV